MTTLITILSLNNRSKSSQSLRLVPIGNLNYLYNLRIEEITPFLPSYTKLKGSKISLDLVSRWPTPIPLMMSRSTFHMDVGPGGMCLMTQISKRDGTGKAAARSEGKVHLELDQSYSSSRV